MFWSWNKYPFQTIILVIYHVFQLLPLRCCNMLMKYCFIPWKTTDRAFQHCKILKIPLFLLIHFARNVMDYKGYKGYSLLGHLVFKNLEIKILREAGLRTHLQIFHLIFNVENKNIKILLILNRKLIYSCIF